MKSISLPTVELKVIGKTKGRHYVLMNRQGKCWAVRLKNDKPLGTVLKVRNWKGNLKWSDIGATVQPIQLDDASAKLTREVWNDLSVGDDVGERKLQADAREQAPEGHLKLGTN